MLPPDGALLVLHMNAPPLPCVAIEAHPLKLLKVNRRLLFHFARHSRELSCLCPLTVIKSSDSVFTQRL